MTDRRDFEMAIEFNEAFYFQSKFNQLKAEGRLEEFGLSSVEDLKQYFTENDIDPQQHYRLHGAEEGIDPSPAFDTSAYLEAKLNGLQATEQYADFTLDDLIETLQTAGLTPLEHYNRFGIDEGTEVRPVDEITFGGEIDLTQGADILLAPDAKLPEGTAEEDVVRTTTSSDLVKGVASALSSERTLNLDDTIDGGPGRDTLEIQM
ncbi:hypothetical protein GLV89_13530 [Halomonas alkaliantarctica]|nr:hypothetical protein [Halomonas alkaliantarctica]